MAAQLIAVDLEKARLADDASRPFAIFGSPFSATVTLQDGTGGAYDPDSDATYTLTVDDDYNFTADDVMAFGYGSISGGTAIVFQLDTFTTKYESVINGRPARRAYWQLNEQAGTVTRVVAQDWLEARGSVAPVEGTASQLQPLVTRAEAAANIATTAANVAAAASQNAEQSAERAEEAAASISIPTPTQQDDGKCITVVNGEYALRDELVLTSITIGESTWDATGLSIVGAVTIWGEGMVPATLTDTTLNIGTVTNGTFSLPFFIPITSTTATVLTLEGDQAFVWDLTSSTSTNTLEVNSTIYSGAEKLWAIDIKLGANAAVQYGLSFDDAGSDALTASKVNRCIVRFDGTWARLYVYATEDLA